MTIRLATAADAPRLVAMAKAFLIHTRYGEIVRFNDTCLFELVDRVLLLGAVYVADVDDRLVGMIAVVELVNPISGDPYADELVWWVEPDARHRSLGPRLLKSAEAWANGRNLSMIKMVAPTGTHVGSFYTRMGYTPVETAFIKRLP